MFFWKICVLNVNLLIIKVYIWIEVVIFMRIFIISMNIDVGKIYVIKYLYYVLKICGYWVCIFKLF